MMRNAVPALVCMALASLSGCKLIEFPGLETKERMEPSKLEPSVEIVPGDPGLPGGARVSSDGKKVWPPTGPGCERLVKCCNAAGKTSSTVGLGCQLSVATEPVDCKKALETVRSTIRDTGQALPPECR